MKMKQRITLLGGEGFVGRNIAAHFSQEMPCLSIGKEPSLFKERGDVFFLADPYRQKIEHESDVIIHLIDNKVPLDDFLEQEKRLAKNIALDSRHHLILFSSAALYVNPTSEYGQRKQLLEEFYTEYCKAHAVSFTILRLFNTYGPYQIPYRQGSLVANLIYNHLKGKPTEINDLEVKRDFLFSRDIPKFVEYALEQNLQGVFDIGTGKLTTISELVTYLEKKTLKQSISIVNKGLKESMPDRAAGKALLEKVSMVDFDEGLAEASQFYQNNFPVIETYVERKEY
jgi:nucleoside-diphosphate-sugar epimerase